MINYNETERILVPYALPNGEIVKVDNSAAKNAMIIDYTLRGGKIVQALKVREERKWESQNVQFPIDSFRRAW